MDMIRIGNVRYRKEHAVQLGLIGQDGKVVTRKSVRNTTIHALSPILKDVLDGQEVTDAKSETEVDPAGEGQTSEGENTEGPADKTAGLTPVNDGSGIERPSTGAPTIDWVAYAVARGLDEDVVSTMKRSEIMELLPA